MYFYSSTVHKTNSASPECAIRSLREREQEKRGINLIDKLSKNNIYLYLCDPLKSPPLRNYKHEPLIPL